VAVRGDIDALPIKEQTGLEYSSITGGVMHACGHDVHASWTLGAGYLLSRAPAEGDVLLVFQPAEETGKGALAVLESGALDGVQAIFGAHVDRRYPVGSLVAQEGPLAASSDEFTIELKGRGAHGARPHEGSDPIVGAALLVSSLQSIVSRRVSPAVPAVVTVGMLEAGTAPNIIPDTAKLAGTTRAVDKDTRRLLIDAVQTMSKSIAEAMSLEARVTIREGTPPIVNPARPVAWARAAAANILGAEAILPLRETNLGAEDFAFYLEKIEGCFLRIGACEEGGRPIPAHSPHFYAAEESIFVGASVLAETARIASKALAEP
jgi:hippurate hydrolase